MWVLIYIVWNLSLTLSHHASVSFGRFQPRPQGLLAFQYGGAKAALKAAPYWKARRPWGRGCGRFFLGFAQAYLCKIGQTTSLFTSQSADLLFRGVAPLTKKPEDFWFVVFPSSSPNRSFEQVHRARMSNMPSQHLFPLMLLTVVSSGFAKGKLKELSKA